MDYGEAVNRPMWRTGATRRLQEPSTCLSAIMHFQNPVLCSNDAQTELEDKGSFGQNQNGKEGILAQMQLNNLGCEAYHWQAELILPSLVRGPLGL